MIKLYYFIASKHLNQHLLICCTLLSRFSHVRLCVTPEMAAHQAPPSLGFSRQEHWSGLPFPSPMHESEKWKWSHSVVSDSSRFHGLQPTRLLHPWDFPGKSTGVECRCLLLKTYLGQDITLFSSSHLFPSGASCQCRRHDTQVQSLGWKNQYSENEYTTQNNL